jgi:DNA-binding PucR family transcriptional regulator
MPVSGDLVATARAYLDLGGDVAAATAALGIHRQTLYYRLRKIKEVTGMSISSGTDRLELHAGLRLAGLIRHMGEVTGGR